MIKKLVLTTFFLFVAFGAMLPHSLNAQTTSNDSVGGPVCGSGSPAGDALFCVIDSKTNGNLGNDPCGSDYLGGIPTVLNFLSYAGLGTPYGALRTNVFKTTGKCPEQLTTKEVSSYFQQQGTSTGGVAGLLTNINAQLLDQRPASGVDFVGEKVFAISNFGKVSAATNPEPSTYYPGPGSELLRPIQAFWGWSVNLVFGFLVLLIIVIALAIMFRQRLGGAAEVTIQNAIPSIALAMILIPLSYAISGLFIDGITLGTNVVHGFLLGPQSPGAAVYANRDNKDLVNCDLQNKDAGSATNCDRGLYADDPTIDVWRSRARIDIRDAGTTLGQSINNSLAGVPSAQAIFNLIGSILSIISTKNGQFSQYAWFGNIINLIIGVLTIWIALKIFWKLLNKYFTLIIMPAFSPFIFATAALPGNGTKSIVSYLKTMGSAALFYIVTYAMFILTMIFTDSTFQNSLPDFRTSGYIPPLLGIQAILKDLTTTANSFPLTQLLMTLVGLGIYFSIPKTLDGIDEALGTKFILPELIKTPFASMQESFKIATRAFPAAAARATQITAGGARGVASTGVNAGFNVRRAIQKAQGIDEREDPRSVVFQRNQANTRRRQELVRRLDATESIPERAKINAELARLNVLEGLQGKEFSTQGEEGKDRRIKASFQWLNANDLGSIRYNFLTNDQQEVQALLRKPNPSDDKNYRLLGSKLYLKRTIAKLVIEPENFEFVNPTEVAFAGIEADSNGVEKYQEKIHQFLSWGASDDIMMTDEGKDKYTGFEYGNGEKIAGNEVLIRPTKDNSKLVPAGGKKIEILFDLLIDVTTSPARLFNPGTGIIAKGIQSPKRGVKIGPYMTSIGRMSVGIGTR